MRFSKKKKEKKIYAFLTRALGNFLFCFHRWQFGEYALNTKSGT